MSAAAEKGWRVDERGAKEIIRDLARQSGVTTEEFISHIVNAYGDRAARDLRKSKARP